MNANAGKVRAYFCKCGAKARKMSVKDGGGLNGWACTAGCPPSYTVGVTRRTHSGKESERKNEDTFPVRRKTAVERRWVEVAT